MSILSSLQNAQHTIASHDSLKTIILQMNSFVLLFESRVSKIFSRQFITTEEILSQHEFIMIANVAISQALLTIAFNVDLSRFDIELVNDEIVKREMKN